MRIKKVKPAIPRPGGQFGRTHGNAGVNQFTSEADEDPVIQAALLSYVLDEHPMQLRQCDLARELCQDPSDASEIDAVDRAIEVLMKVGLLDRNDEHVFPTPSSLHFRKLLHP